MISYIKTLMAMKGVNMSEAAKAAGVSSTTISRYLNNNTDLRADTLCKLLNFLGADINDILKKRINTALGNLPEFTVGEDIQYLLEKASPIDQRTITDSIIVKFRSNTDAGAKTRVKRLVKYRDSIKTMRRG